MDKEKKMQDMPNAVQFIGDGYAKKVYRTPQFRVYGTIREVTQGAGRRQVRDGAGGTARGFKSIAG
jgi:hypothetical protein